MYHETPARHLDRLRSAIAETITAYRPLDERGTTSVPGLAVGRIAQPMSARTYIYEPSLCISVQGTKQVALGDQRFAYDEDRFLLTSIGLPTIIEVPGANVDHPYTALQLNLDLDAAHQIIADMNTGGVEVAPREPGFTIASLSPELLDVVARLVALLKAPHDIPILASFIHKELLYRLLTGPAGGRLRQIVRIGSQSHRVAVAVAWLRTNFANRVRIEDLAELSGMGVSTLHRHFQELTTMSPIQYQKQLRLHEARRLMLNENLDVGSAAYRVGYESVTQFSREYRRLFGAPPKRDTASIARNGSL
jgi:AraC-like DNA-binding protein